MPVGECWGDWPYRSTGLLDLFGSAGVVNGSKFTTYKLSHLLIRRSRNGILGEVGLGPLPLSARENEGARYFQAIMVVGNNISRSFKSAIK